MDGAPLASALMPNRILREGILTSRRVNKLSERAELFYRRLMSRLDDYGRCDADAELLRTGCYPLRVDKVKGAQIEGWLQDCKEAGLLVIYHNAGKRYVQYLDWKQQERSESKFPAPDRQVIADAQQMIANAHLVVDVVVDVSEGDYMSGKPDVDKPENKINGHDLKAVARGVLDFLNEKTGKRYQPVEANLGMIVARLRGGATERELKQVVAKKCREWGGDEKMAMYLRPATLFNATKFAQYQGELGRADGG